MNEQEKKAWDKGFRDGFLQQGAEAYSPDHFAQTQYFSGYSEGSEHLKKAQELSELVGIEDLNELHRLAIDRWYKELKNETAKDHN